MTSGHDSGVIEVSQSVDWY